MKDYRNRWERLYGTSKKVSKQKRSQLIAGFLILAIFMIILLVVVGSLFAKNNGESGAILLPEQSIPVAEPIAFMQKDPEWADDLLGTSRDTMAASGCLVTAIASGLDMQAKAENSDFYITPKSLNQVLTDAEAYTDGGAVIWEKIKTALPQTEVYVAGKVDMNIIDKFLENGLFPVVKVRVGGNGAYHWVLLIGAEDGHYVCMDPLSKTGEPVSLAVFKDRIYSMRAVYLKKDE